MLAAIKPRAEVVFSRKMPLTPFHFGPGLLIKSVARPVFSCSAFVVAQVFIDCESLYYLLHHQYPVHRFFHTLLGAATAGLVAAGSWLLIVRFFIVVLSDVMESMRSSAALRSEFSPIPVIMGGFIGGISHSCLDGIMHRDLRPFMPFSDCNPFLGLVGVGMLHLACVAAAVFGVVGITLWKTHKSHKDFLLSRQDKRTSCSGREA